jgi:hypothetical protein
MRPELERRIDEFLANDNPALDWVKTTVRYHRFLPLYLGWTATLGIRPDGSLIRWNSEESPDAVIPLTDSFLERMALCQGTRKYPELRALLPRRPSSARDCDLCGGTGEFPGAPRIVCHCAGIGWLIPGEQTADFPG